MARQLQAALLLEDKPRVEKIAGELLNGIVNALEVPEIRVRILASRPTTELEELHGLYEPGEGRKKARITAWMRTARHKKIVAYRSFLRTLLHELCHHLDYELFELAESFHTEGFFKRESQLFKQLVPADSK